MSAENGKVHYTKPLNTKKSQTAKVKVIPDASAQRVDSGSGSGNIANTAANITNHNNTISNIKKIMNGTTSTATAQLHKLTSLKPARDLTLGGRGGAMAAAAAANKKVFTPNLNVVRNKNTNVKTSKDTTARGGRGGARGRGAGRGAGARGGRGGAAGGGSNSLIQTTGVFSEGAGAVNIRKATTGSSSFSRNADDAPSQMRKPTLIKSEHKKIDLKADEQHVRELLGDTDEDDFADDKTDLEQIPIKLNEAKWKAPKRELKIEKLEDDVLMKSLETDEHATDGESAVAIAQKMQSLHVQHAQQQQQQQHRTNSALARFPESVTELLEIQQSQLLLLQLPDTLPCEEEGMDALADKAKHDKVDSANTLLNSPAPAQQSMQKRLTLKEMEEGKIGKLLRYKSGKVKLVFGDTYFDLTMGMETGFLQDLMSINTNRDERSGNMINLGPIQAKLTATPDWEHLLKQEQRRQRPNTMQQQHHA